MSAAALPQFTQLNLDHFPESLDALLKANLQTINSLLSENDRYSWDNLMQPLEDMEDELERFFSPMAHLHAVTNSPELRACYQACLPKLSAYESAVGHNHALYEAIASINEADLDAAQQKIIKDALLDFKLSGVALSTKEKKEFEVIQARLSELSNQFENHVLDATQAFELHVAEPERVAGLPEHALHQAAVLAKDKNLSGWVFNLEIPCFLAVSTYAHDRQLRETLYEAYVTRASDKGPNAGEFDNTPIMDEILALRHKKAKLLGFNNYAELSLATKMADSPEQVLSFLLDLTERSHAQAQNEFAELQAFAKNQFDMTDIKPWDIAYLSEKKKQALHAISQEELRAYFPLPKVMEGLFSILNKMYGIHFTEVNNADVWHQDVACYQVLDDQQNTRGYLYADLFARPNKRGGAWMDSCQSRRKLPDGRLQLPVAMLTCNFAKAVAGKPAALSHDEVVTLFHEMGHCLHHLLTKVDYLSASGIHGVEWDAVELPSQFFENWCWEEEALPLMSSHTETGQILPKETFDKLLAAKNFQSAMAMARQLEFSLFDFRIHRDFKDQPQFIQHTLDDVRQKTAVVPPVTYNRFQHSFSHIFGGGYAAGYYSYKWAEVLSSDAFARFEEEGIFNPATGRDFLQCILEVGGAKKAETAFEAFRGRPATVDALLRHNGIQG